MVSSRAGSEDTPRRRQEAIADLSQRALEREDLGQLLQDAVSTVVDGLDADYCAALERGARADEFVLRHGDGAAPVAGTAAGTTVRVDSGTTNTLVARTPIVFGELHDEPALEGLDVLTDLDVAGGAVVRIGTSEDSWGVLVTLTSDRREFDDPDTSFLQSVANVLASTIERERTRSELDEIYGRISDAFFGLDEEWRFTHLNQRAQELINPEGRELVGKRVWDEFPAAIGRKFKPKYERAMYEQETVSFEEYYPEPLDTWFEVRAYPSETGLSVYFRDVTDRKVRERELQRTERRFQAIFEDPNILVGLLDPDGTVLDINRTAMEYVDTDLDAVTGQPFWETPWWGESDDLREDVRAWVDRAADGEYVDFEAELTLPDGGDYVISGYFRPVTNEEGEVVSIIVSDRDITERRKRERELEESGRRYRTLVENFPNGVVALVDEELRYQTVGGDPQGVANATVDEVEGSLVSEVLPTELANVLVPRYEAALEDGKADTFEVERNGNFYQFQVVPVHDGNGEIFAALGMSQDLTGREEVKRRLEESERRYRTLVEHFPNGIVTLFDEDLRYTLAAGEAFDHLPVAPDDVEGRTPREAWNECVADEFESLLETTLDGESDAVELSYADRDWIVHAVPLADSEGEVFAGMTMAQDITERKAQERSLREAKTQLEAATEAGAVGTWEWHIPEDRFVAGASFARTFDVDPDAARKGVSIDRFVSSIHEDDVARVERKIEEAVESCGAYEAEYRVWNADDELQWVVARGQVECDENGEPVSFPGTVTDITERKEAELELQRNKEQLESLFEVLPVGVVVADADGRLVEANDVAREIWGGGVSDADSGDEYEKFPAVWADTNEPVAVDEWTMSRVLEGEEVTDPDVYEIETVDGDSRIIRAKGMPVRDGSGSVTRGVVTFTDVTDRRENQRKLEESERRYRTLVENFPNGSVGLFDETLEYTAVGGELLEDAGVDVDERVGSSVHEVYPDDLVEEIEPHYLAAIDGEASTFDMEHYGRNLFARTLPVRNADGEVFAGMIVVQDVTERREYEQKLEKSERRYRTLAEHFPNGAVAVYDDDLRYTLAEGAVLGDTLPSADRLEGKQVPEIFPASTAENLEPVFRAAIDDGVTGSTTTEFDGRNWRVWATPLRDGDGEIFAGLSFTQDITEQVEREQALRESKKQLRTLIELLPVAVFVAEADGRIVEWNEAAEEVWGGRIAESESVAEYERYDGWWADTGEPVEPDEWALARALRGEEVTDPDVIEIEGFDGERRTILNHGMPVRDENGEVSRAIVTLIDVTKRKEYQRELEESNERLEQFAYAASHDLQEPLRMVSSYLQLIERRYADELDEEAGEFLEFAVDGADRMRDMIDGLLQYSRVETRGDPFEPVDLDDVLGNVRDDLQMKIGETGAEITSEPLPQVRGDREQLRQVFQNLVDNAIEYSGDDPPRVHVSANRRGDEWAISVRDEGVGIDPTDTDRIFEVFQRLHGPGDHDGTGIGLALCERIVERHDGEICVDSTPGEGSTFTFTLPATGDADA